MKNITTCLIGVLALTFWSPSFAECPVLNPRYIQLKIESCSSATKTALSEIDGKGYSQAERAAVERSAGSTVIVRALPVADVEIIWWNSNGRQHLFKGEVKPMVSPMIRGYQLDMSSPENCEKLYAGKILLFSVHEIASCRDMGGIGESRKEVSAQLNLPFLNFFGELEELHSIGIKLPDVSN